MYLSTVKNKNVCRTFQIFIAYFALLAILLATVFANSARAMGEKYTNEGQALSAEIDKELIRQKLCKDSADCFLIVPMYGGHGNRVNFTIYKPDKKALAVIFQFLILYGTEITKGIPISITVFPKSREEYGNMFFTKEAIIELEIK